MAPDTASAASGHGEPKREAADPKPVQPAVTPNDADDPNTEEKTAALARDSRAERSPLNDKEAPSRIRLGLQAGGRVIPKFPTWVGEAVLGFRFLVGGVATLTAGIDFSL